MLNCHNIPLIAVTPTRLQPLLFVVVDVEQGVDNFVAGDVLFDVVLHIYLQINRNIAQPPVALLIIPRNDFFSGLLLHTFTNPNLN